MQNHEDQERPRQQPTPEPAPEQPEDTGAALGRLGAEPHDTSLGAPTPAAASHRKRSGASLPAQAGEAPPAEEPLRLPRGGLAAMRKSGGLRFSSREIVVYRSGKVTYQQTAPAASGLQTRHLPLSQLVELHHALQQSGLAQLPATAGRHSPDTFAYEIVARVGRSVRAFEVFEGSIPEALAPLIRELRALMPDDQ